MQNKIQAFFENKPHRKIFGITYQERKTNVFVRNRMIEIIGNSANNKTTQIKVVLTYIQR